MSAVDELIRLVEEVSGVVVPVRDRASLERIAEERAKVTGLATVERYVRSLRSNLDGGDWQQLLGLITVKESYLFRASQQFRALEDQVLPNLTSQRETPRLRVWCAGCARGEEAATLAVVLAESKHLLGWDWRILATDVDEAALEEARRGLYGRRAVAQVPPPMLERYFRARAGGHELVPGLRARIDCRPLNLTNLPLELPEAPLDIVFLRNVLIYFRPDLQRRVVEAVAATLAPDGYLFLGPAESLWQLAPGLVAVDLGGCFCYRWPGQPSVASEPAAVTPVRSTSSVPSAWPEMQVPAARTDAVRPAAPAEPTSGTTKPELEPVLALLVAGRLDEAHRLAAGEAQRFPDNAALRALDGLAADVGDNGEVAVRAYRAALYLEPKLYQVRYLLARRLLREGWSEQARRAFREALAALEAPDAVALPGSERLVLPSPRQVAEGCRMALASKSHHGASRGR